MPKKLTLTALLVTLAAIAMTTNSLLSLPSWQIGRGTPPAAATAQNQLAQVTAVSTLLATPTLAPVGVVPNALIQPAGTATVDPNSTPPQASTTLPTVSVAEAAAETDWITPFNLSHSGATSAPQLVIDSTGRYHAFWRDAIDGFAYAAGDGAGWSEPVIIEAPFVTRRYLTEEQLNSPTPIFTPYLVADAQGNLHAFWVDDSGLDTPVLYHSQVPGGQFTNFDAWSPRQALEGGAVAPSAALDSAGRLHLAYVRTVEDGARAAGVYYRRLDTGGAWSEPVALYLSRYLRSAGGEDANVQVAAYGDGPVAIAWDDAGREQVFVVRSLDGGRSWETPLEIDRRAPEDAADSSGPSRITVGLGPGQLVLTWGAGHEPGRECTQYFRSFNDVDHSWTLPQPMDELASCLTDAQFLAGNTALFLLGGVEQAGVRQGETVVTSYLMAWDGERWSLPQIQEPLRTFLNLDTNQSTNLGCQAGILTGDNLSVIACDMGTGRDVWWMSRAVGDTAEWFPPTPVWFGPDRVAGSETEPVSLQLVTDGAGNTHAFWHDTENAEISHMRWDGRNWSSPVPVLVSPNGAVEQLAVAANNDRLYLAARDSNGLFFSEASADRSTEWSAPRLLDESRPGASSPFIMADNSGIYIVYAVALNEQRGIYLIRSADGKTWSEPRMIFDGTAAGWDMVDQPQLAKTQGGELHLQLLRRSLPPEARSQALAYSRSTDDGITWSATDEVVQTPIVWSRLQGVGERVLHRLWVEEANSRGVIWHAQSIDDGLTWGQATQVSSLDEGELPAAVLDPAGRPHLLALNDGRLLDWLWDGEQWTADESLQTALADGGLLGASADTAGRLVALYAGLLPGMSDAEAGREFFAMWRPLSFPTGELPQPPTLTPAPPPTATPPATSAPSPTPTLVISGAPDSNPLARIPGASGRMGQLGLALLPALLVVGVVVVVGLRAMRMGKK